MHIYSASQKCYYIYLVWKRIPEKPSYKKNMFFCSRMMKTRMTQKLARAQKYARPNLSQGIQHLSNRLLNLGKEPVSKLQP